MRPVVHRTGTGHIPAARAVSWACTCGAAEVLDYGDTFTGEWALQIAAARADRHRNHHNLTAGEPT